MSYVFVGKGVLLGKGGRKIKKGEEVKEGDICEKTAKMLMKQKVIIEGKPEDLQRRIDELEEQVQKNREKANGGESASIKKPGRPAKDQEAEK